MIPETKQEEQQREWLFFSGKVGDELKFESGNIGIITKLTDLYMIIKMKDSTNILFKDKIHFN